MLKDFFYITFYFLRTKQFIEPVDILYVFILLCITKNLDGLNVYAQMSFAENKLKFLVLIKFLLRMHEIEPAPQVYHMIYSRED